MSLQGRLAAQDANKLIAIASSLSLVYSYTTNGVTNFALFLFGIVAHEMTSSTAPLQQFVILILFTGIFDLIRLPNVGFSLGGICAFAVMLLKIPIFFTCLAKLQERGGDVRLGPGSFGFQNAPNWSMPSQFSGGHSQTQSHNQAPPPPPGVFPSSGGFRLGGEDEEDNNSSGPPPAPAPGRNGYSSIA